MKESVNLLKIYVIIISIIKNYLMLKNYICLEIEVKVMDTDSLKKGIFIRISFYGISKTVNNLLRL